MFYQELIKELKKKDYSEKQLAKLKRNLALKYKQKKIPTNIEILLACSPNDSKLIKNKLLTKPTRTISGVAPVAIMTKPHQCPHAITGIGPCIMCPGGLNSHFGDVPQSYTGKEPATMRGIRNKYDSYLQVFNRLEQYILLGHCIDKIEIIVMGGTFPSLPIKYQTEFVWGAFKAMNDFSKLFYIGGEFKFTKFKKFFELPVKELSNQKRIERIHSKLKKLKGKYTKNCLEPEQIKNETANVKCVALAIETRPDFCKEKEIQEMRKLGCTRVELGIQHTDNRVLKKINRGHTVEDSIQSTKLLKEYLFKVTYHIMPGLIGSSITQDKKMLMELIENENFRPDALKIYPCMVTKGTKLYQLYKQGKYKPLTTENTAQLIAWFKEKIPSYCRVMRVQRDISSHQIEAGVQMTNLRQYIHQKYKPKCKCIRCREPKGKNINLKNLKFKTRIYRASKGTEYFISAEADNSLLGFCRLRISNYKAGIRELHVYGVSTGIGEKGTVQHQGVGKKLIGKAEQIVKKKKIKELTVISGIGVRRYYQKQNYKKQGTYLVKLMK